MIIIEQIILINKPFGCEKCNNWPMKDRDGHCEICNCFIRD